MLSNNVNAASFWGGKGKRVELIKRLKLMHEFEEAFEGLA
jgi:hypothetical protein